VAVSENSVVEIHYTLTNSEGAVIDSSEGHAPLAYLHGHGNIIPGLEKQLLSRQEGDKLDVVVAADEAYGEYIQELVQEVPRTAFAEGQHIEAGMEFRVETPQGPRTITVTNLNDTHVTIDANHPLAGQILNFQVEVVSIREATQEELAHGHPHNGHDHHCEEE
jgi:FKBP-type peptidyl-prolyl cis-trans isomerase SlyD